MRPARPGGRTGHPAGDAPGAKLDEQRRAEIAGNLARAKEAFDNLSFTKDRQSRRAQGLYATAHVLNGVLLADTDATLARAELRVGYDLLALLCKEAAGVTVDPVHRYYLAAGRAVMSEFSTTPRTPERTKERIDALRDAVEQLGGKRLHPDDIAQFRAFRSLADEPEFKKLMGELRAKADAKPLASVSRDALRTSGSSP